MVELIRHVRRHEWDNFMRFLEKCYGHPRGFFLSRYSHIYHPDKICLENFYVIEKKGTIISHVGLFPLDTVAEDVKITLGGIGGVATLAEARGKGYMRRLLSYVITQIEKKELPVSVLWGDRQRYGNFGWESAGENLVLEFTERSLAKAGIKGISSIQEVVPEKAISNVRQLYINQKFRVDRGGRLKDILCRAGNRIWIGDDGYLCGECLGNKLIVGEAVSLSGNEASFIMAAMQWCFVQQAEIAVCGHDRDYIDKLIRPAYGWAIRPEGMFRINNCFKFLSLFIPVLEKRASELKIGDFSISVGLRFNGKVDVVTVGYESGRIHLSQKKNHPYLELNERDGVRFFMGGPFGDSRRAGVFSALLPLPIHIPALDRV